MNGWEWFSGELEDEDAPVTWPRLIVTMIWAVAVGISAGWVVSRLMMAAHGLPVVWLWQ